MGCHTWFSKKLTRVEIEKAQHHARYKAWDCIGDGDFEPARAIEDSINRCDYAWLLNGYGFNEGIVIKYREVFYLTVQGYHDVFRVKNYPKKKLFNLRQLRRFLGKRWYDLTQEQINTVKKFWKKYPKGIIYFG